MTRTTRISDLIIPKFWPAFNDREHTHKILTSGRAGTKSSEAAIEVVYKIVSEEDCSAVVIRKRHNKLRKTVYKEIKRAIKRLGLPESLFKITVSPMEITYKPNGNTIYFTGSTIRAVLEHVSAGPFLGYCKISAPHRCGARLGR